MLVQEGIVNQEQVEEALSHQKENGGKTVEILIKLGYLDVDTFSKFLSIQPGVASIDLQHYSLTKEIVELIPKEFALKHEVLPIDRLGSLLTVAMACPLDKKTLGELEDITGLRVKALLCGINDVHATLERFYPPEKSKTPAPEQIGSSIRLNHVATLIRQIDDLPTLPATVQRVKALVDDPNSAIREVGEIISMDPPISARLLKLANSAAYGFPNAVDNVPMAATLLGLKETYNVVLSSAVIDVVERSSKFDYKQFWEDALFCATAARRIARHGGKKSAPGIFTAGMLHDIGRFALAETDSARYAKVKRFAIGRELIASETEIIGIAHTEAGWLLADKWGLPHDITECIRFHHAPQMATEHLDAVRTIALASFMTEARRSGRSADVQFFNDAESLLEAVRLTAEEGLEIYNETRHETAETPG